MTTLISNKLYRVTIGDNKIQYHSTSYPLDETEDNWTKVSLFSTQLLNWQKQAFEKLVKNFGLTLYCELNIETLCWVLYIKKCNFNDFESCVTDSSFDYLIWPNINVQAPKLLVFDMGLYFY